MRCAFAAVRTRSLSCAFGGWQFMRARESVSSDTYSYP
jgi:hypothetical protein